MNSLKNKLKNILATPVGIVLLSLAIVMIRFLPGTGFLDFFSGFLLGLSLVLSSYYIIIISRKQNTTQE